MRKNIFRGIGVALVTPFTEKGDVDVEALEKLVERQVEGGVDFLCVLGTTAETPCLSESDKQLVMQTVRRVADGRLPLLLGCGGNNTANVVAYLKNGDLTGFDGVLIVCPYYNKPSQEGLFQHFSAVAEASPLPVVLYNVPGRVGVNLLPDTTIRIAKAHKNVVAVKEASGNMEQIANIVKYAPKGFEVLSGDDGITFELIQKGVVGVISVVGNAFPAEFGNMVHTALKGDFERAARMNDKLRPFYRLSMIEGNPAGIKAMLSILGHIENVLRLPLVPVSDATHEEMQEALELF